MEAAWPGVRTNLGGLLDVGNHQLASPVCGQVETLDQSMRSKRWNYLELCSNRQPQRALV